MLDDDQNEIENDTEVDAPEVVEDHEAFNPDATPDQFGQAPGVTLGVPPVMAPPAV